jgi:hypothetical protein
MIFLCDICGAIENSALGIYWGRKTLQWSDASKNGKALCSECTPTHYLDGSPTKYGGKWHDKFPKVIGSKKKVKKLNRSKKKKHLRLIKSKPPYLQLVK